MYGYIWSHVLESPLRLWGHAGTCLRRPYRSSRHVTSTHTPERLESILTRHILAYNKNGNIKRYPFLDKKHLYIMDYPLF